MPADNTDNYDDSPAPPATDGADQPEGQDADKDGQTSILPKSFFSGKDLKPGDKCDVTVVRIHENDVEVAPCEDKGEEEQPPPGEEPEPAAPPSAMSSMLD